MAPSKSFVIRVAIYSMLLLYVVADLVVFHGPLHRQLRRADPGSPEAIADARARGEVARVFHHPIVIGQLERAVADRLRREGRKPEDLSPGQLRLARYAALNELIDHQLLRVKTKANALEVPVSAEDVDAELAVFSSRFNDPAELAAAMRAQRIASKLELRFRLAGRMQQERYLESRIGPATSVSDDEARAWFEEHRKDFTRPERIRARHVFVATLERDAAEAKKILAEALTRLQTGKADFATLAAGLSEDERSKQHGGELGWFSRKRLPADFGAAIFALPAKTPSLIQTKLGWHLVEVLERKPAEPLPFDEAKPGLVAALETDRRRRALEKFRTDIRKMERKNVHVFRDVIDQL